MNAINKHRFHKKIGLLAISIPILLATHGYAQIATDGTLGPVSNLTGPDFRIGHELGVTLGTTLFHSFERFSIHSGESATFTGPETLHNVISRVTGGSVSTIDGLLRSEIGTADFYFINPAGVVFGPNARVDVPAAFHVSTADEVRFAGGSVFSATTPAASALTAEAPESFGYLGPRATSLVVNGSKLDFVPGSSVSLCGGEVTVQGETTNPSRISAPGGEIRIYAVGDTSDEVNLTGELKSGAGKLQVTRALIETSGTSGGELDVGAGKMTVTDARLAANNTETPTAPGRPKAGTITIRVADLLEVLSGGQISSSTFWAGNAGQVEIEAGNLRIDGKDSPEVTGIASNASAGSAGNAGTVKISVTDLLEILNTGQISSSTLGTGYAGHVEIEAGNLRIDGHGSSYLTGITSNAAAGSSGKAGTLTIKVADMLEVLSGGQISSSTLAAGDAGGVEIEARNVRINGHGLDNFTGVTSQAAPQSSGNAGTVTITVADLLEILSGGQISSSTFAVGDAGGVEITSGNLRIDGQGSGQVTGVGSRANPGSIGNAGTVTVSVADLLEVLNDGGISSSTFAAGNAGGVEIEAKRMRIDGKEATNITGIASNAKQNSRGNAGKVMIRVADLLEILNGGDISSSTFSVGDAGGVEIEARNVRIDGQGSARFTGIAGNANVGSIGNAGTVTIRVAGLLEVLNGGMISSSTLASGGAGGVGIDAGCLRIDGQGSSKFTGIASNATSGSSGNAGRVTIKIAGLLEVLNGGEISSSTFGGGDAGGVEIESGRLRVDGQGSTYVTGILSNAGPSAWGKAGTVTLRVSDLLEVLNGGQISSSTFARGGAGGVEIDAGSLRIDRQGSSQGTGIASQAAPRSIGDAGTVTIRVAGLLEVLNGGQISSGTFATGDAGGVQIEAKNLRIDGQGSSRVTGIGSKANSGSAGRAGKVTIRVTDLLAVLNGGGISSSTFSAGEAGGVTINAGELLIDGQGSAQLTFIASASQESAQGFAGNLDIEAGKLTARNEGLISIESHQSVSEEALLQVPKALLFIKSPVVLLDQGARITAESWGNVPAATIGIQTDEIRVSGNSSITTSATGANGGPITIQGNVIDLWDSLITSSVEGLSGDGGDITIKGAGAAKALILEGGFIQANAPAGARGGDIFIDAKAVIPEGGVLEVGGLERQRFLPGSGENIIQAAAPGGEQGTIRITSPELDISGSLINLDTRLTETIRLGADPCPFAGNIEMSSLAFAGPGGVPAGPDQHAALSFNEGRLNTILMFREDKKAP
jgi:filamentous hemagglutinin family protein